MTDLKWRPKTNDEIFREEVEGEVFAFLLTAAIATVGTLFYVNYGYVSVFALISSADLAEVLGIGSVMCVPMAIAAWFLGNDFSFLRQKLEHNDRFNPNGRKPGIAFDLFVEGAPGIVIGMMVGGFVATSDLRWLAIIGAVVMVFVLFFALGAYKAKKAYLEDLKLNGLASDRWKKENTCQFVWSEENRCWKCSRCGNDLNKAWTNPKQAPGFVVYCMKTPTGELLKAYRNRRKGPSDE